ncbi:hypothetical protein SAY86_022701 [Trapa natans]|uniref:Uncharacterized protein n=1 Tax=Trapa natans TaxID=22666 RepID=A0AAN7LTD2_TRANT|nr:hypothetical protein SAY86_022701 [Trapa natans]
MAGVAMTNLMTHHQGSSAKTVETTAVHELRVEVISEETVKPSSPTPDEIRTTFRISVFDQFSPAIYVPVLLFYRGGDEKASDKSRRLRLALSDVLTQFYPLAGRIKENFWVDCSDQGVAYKEAKVGCLLDDILEKPEPAALTKLLPIAVESPESGTGLLLLIQASFFECGGVAVGVCISHKIADGASLGTFLRSWAGSARGEVASPSFTISSTFPPREDLKSLPTVELAKDRCVTRRFVFESSRMAALRAKASGPAVPLPTRVEAASALIWKCASNASRRSHGDPSRPAILSHAVNLRRKPAADLHLSPENSMGNLVGSFTTRNDDAGAEVACLVADMRASRREYMESYPKILQVETPESTAKMVSEAAAQFSSLMNSDGADFYNCSSWCNFRLYETDFGRGRPAWVATGGSEFKNSIVLVDSNDKEGVEVWLTLTETDMTELESDQELLQFALVNPGIITSPRNRPYNV